MEGQLVLAPHPCPKWRRRIEAAVSRGRFLGGDAAKAKYPPTCLVAERAQRDADSRIHADKFCADGLFDFDKLSARAVEVYQLFPLAVAANDLTAARRMLNWAEHVSTVWVDHGRFAPL